MLALNYCWDRWVSANSILWKRKHTRIVFLNDEFGKWSVLRELRLTLGTEDVQTRIFNWKLVDAQLKNSM